MGNTFEGFYDEKHLGANAMNDLAWCAVPLTLLAFFPDCD